MSRALDVAGLCLVGVMTAAFVGAFKPEVEAGLSAVFWGCAAAVLGIIMYRKRRRPAVSPG